MAPIDALYAELKDTQAAWTELYNLLKQGQYVPISVTRRPPVCALRPSPPVTPTIYLGPGLQSALLTFTPQKRPDP